MSTIETVVVAVVVVVVVLVVVLVVVVVAVVSDAHVLVPVLEYMIVYEYETRNNGATLSNPTFFALACQRNSFLVSLCHGARRAEMAAPATVEVRDALAVWRIHTRLFAFLQARDFSW